MKKYLPLILLGLGILVLAGGMFFILRKPQTVDSEEEALMEIPLADRPFVSLTPTKEGYYLDLKIDNIKIDAATLDYELVYELPDSRMPGVPGSNIAIQKGVPIERKLLLGGESSGHIYPDRGVETGSFTIKFRNDKGKLIAKLSTDFHLQTNTDTLSSLDNEFVLKLEKTPKDAFFLTMGTFGLPQMPEREVASGPYGVFSSAADVLNATVKMPSGEPFFFDQQQWTSVQDIFTPGSVFIGLQ